jgi:hypothetical protein
MGDLYNTYADPQKEYDDLQFWNFNTVVHYICDAFNLHIQIEYLAFKVS